MAYYLVTARIKLDKLDELEKKLIDGLFDGLKEFGGALTYSLKHAVMRDDLTAIWEEESYGKPPLHEERSAVLDTYFTILEMSNTLRGIGWEKIREFPRLFPGFI
jgi:hypothetical protein